MNPCQDGVGWSFVGKQRHALPAKLISASVPPNIGEGVEGVGDARNCLELSINGAMVKGERGDGKGIITVLMTIVSRSMRKHDSETLATTTASFMPVTYSLPSPVC